MTTPNPDPRHKRETGRIKWFNFSRGYGFITRNESGEDGFVHYTGISEDVYQIIKENDRVEYTGVRGVKGPKAVEVILLTDD